MPLATYQGRCLDAVDAEAQTRFWAQVLHLEPHRRDDAVGELRIPDGRVAVWVNAVPEPKTVKNRVHLDLNVASVHEVLDAGATPIAEFPRWTTLADPEGNEFCAFTSR